MIKKVLASMFIGYLVFVLVMWFFSAQQIKQTCQQIPMGMPVSKLEPILDSLYLTKIMRRSSEQKTQTILLHSPYSMGRYTCQIQHDGQQVTHVNYQHLD